MEAETEVMRMPHTKRAPKGERVGNENPNHQLGVIHRKEGGRILAVAAVAVAIEVPIRPHQKKTAEMKARREEQE
jgi:hypothetical protein